MTKAKSPSDNPPSIPSKAIYQNKHQQFPPTRRSIPNGFDFDLDVWWPRLHQNQKKSFSGAEGNDDGNMNRTVPAEYYSRHQLLRKESANYIITPTSKGRKGSIPVFTFRPGSTMTQSQTTWPSRAHDGSTERSQQTTRPDHQHSNTPNFLDTDIIHS